MQNPVEASAYLDAVLESGDNNALLIALRDVVDARGGVSELAKSKGFNHVILYRTLAEGGNPTLDTLVKVLKSSGLRLSVLPAQEKQARAS